MFERFTFLDSDTIWNYGLHEDRDGDGIKWAKELDAAFHYPGTVMFAYPKVVGNKQFGGGVPFLFAMQPILRVNENGERFFKEANGGDFTISCNAMRLQNKVFTMLDQKLLEYTHDVAVMVGFDHAVPTGQPMTDAYDVIKEGIDNGQVQKFDTVEQLAAYIDCEVKTLQETIDKYNQACATGVDTEFGTPKPFLHPFKTAPFYCAELQLAMYTTVGGLRVDENLILMVINSKGEPIPGLMLTMQVRFTVLITMLVSYLALSRAGVLQVVGLLRNIA